MHRHAGQAAPVFVAGRDRFGVPAHGGEGGPRRTVTFEVMERHVNGTCWHVGFGWFWGETGGDGDVW